MSTFAVSGNDARSVRPEGDKACHTTSARPLTGTAVSSTVCLMGTRRMVSMEIDTGTVAIAELAAAHCGMSVVDWIARAARREFARIGPGPGYVAHTDAEMAADDAERAFDEAAIAADEAKRFRAAG